MVSEQMDLNLGQYAGRVEAGINALAKEEFSRRLWERDPSVWKTTPEPVKSILNRLGWLNIAESMLQQVGEIDAFVEEVRAAGFTHALLLGMGGSSLCPDVMRITFGVKPGHLDLAMLDSTDPAMVLAREESIDLEKTLFIVASKSGGTAEVNAFAHYFFDKVKQKRGERAGENFIAVTDPGTKAETEARENGFRRVFLNPADIGGRYSALSYFGLVPSALMGIDIRELLSRAVEMMRASAGTVPPPANPSVVTGNAIAELALMGRDKLTFLISPPIESFGDWVEQLVAESTGKEGRGIVPIVGEPVGIPADYGDDRAFVYLRLDGADNAALDAHAEALVVAGQPVIRIRLRDLMDLGREYFRWEAATATMGAILRVNPFDEPNVKESKDNTNALLKEYTEKGALPRESPVLTENGIALFCEPMTAKLLAELPAAKRYPSGSLAGYLAAHFSRLRPSDYVALMAFVPMTDANTDELQAIRLAVRDALSPATTLGFGPRFLHSTGQLHKGGPNTGLFIQITHEPSAALPIPGEPFDFGVLVTAQALGDFNALIGKDRRAVRLHLTGDVEAGLKKLRGIVEQIVR